MFNVTLENCHTWFCQTAGIHCTSSFELGQTLTHLQCLSQAKRIDCDKMAIIHHGCTLQHVHKHIIHCTIFLGVIIYGLFSVITTRLSLSVRQSNSNLVRGIQKLFSLYSNIRYTPVTHTHSDLETPNWSRGRCFPSCIFVLSKKVWWWAVMQFLQKIPSCHTQTDIHHTNKQFSYWSKHQFFSHFVSSIAKRPSWIWQCSISVMLKCGVDTMNSTHLWYQLV